MSIVTVLLLIAVALLVLGSDEPADGPQTSSGDNEQ
jgi:hypothetical protein